MSTIRVSVIRNDVHGVTDRDHFVMLDYRKRTRLGRTEEFREGELPKGKSLLSHYLESKLEPAVAKLGEQPVVVMVHGFLFDPKGAMDEDTERPDPSWNNNPHGRRYHYEVRDEAEEIRKHTSSLPRHLGFREHDGDGSTGLAFAFGWQSQPGFAQLLVHVSGDRPGNVWDHWNYYTYRKNMDLYRSILRNRPKWDISKLRSDGIPDKVSKRWSVFGD